MALTIASHDLGGIRVLDLKGRITLGEGSVQIRDAVRDLVNKGQRNILLDLGEVSFIDSSGLGELVAAYTTARNHGSEVKLLNLSRKGSRSASVNQDHFKERPDLASRVLCCCEL